MFRRTGRGIALIARYYHTLRFVRVSQAVKRVLRSRGISPRARTSFDQQLRPLTSRPLEPPSHPTSRILSERTFLIFGTEVSIPRDRAWDDTSWPRLLAYQTQYCDGLTECAPELAVAIIGNWIHNHHVGESVAWDPYPVSRRVSNWAWWHWTQIRQGRSGLSQEAHASLYAQAEYLSQHVETDLSGNHVIANAKALLMAGKLYAGKMADRWCELASRLLRSELEQQVLTDGGHYERSPMYHGLVLQDVLETLSVLQVYPDARDDRLRQQLHDAARAMCEWLILMTHPDGEIAFFNDTTLGCAPSTQNLLNYATRLGVRPVTKQRRGLHLAASGFARAQQSQAVLFCDIGSVGPAHQPGHAHAGTLSCELSIASTRLIVNGGVSTYEAGEQRQEQRGTRAQSTVEVDGRNSSDVWASFRVGRRARVVAATVRETGSQVLVEATHAGYDTATSRIRHARHWTLTDRDLTVRDELRGPATTAICRYKLHPDVEATIDPHDDRSITLRHRRSRISLGTMRVVEGESLRLGSGTYCPAFNESRETSTVEIPLHAGVAVVRISW